MSGPRIAVASFPGSNDERDTVWALRALGADPVIVWHAAPALPAVAGVVLPGGFSYGDYLRCGAIARFSPLMGAVAMYAESGGLVLGICNGFQILCEAGLLPGVLVPNSGLRFVCRDVELVVEHDTNFTRRSADGAPLRIPVKHGAGRYVHDPESPPDVVLRYAERDNPNGSHDGVAGIVSARGNVMGLMPHPEHAVDPLLGSGDGAYVLGPFVAAAAARSLAAA